MSTYDPDHDARRKREEENQRWYADQRRREVEDHEARMQEFKHHAELEERRLVLDERRIAAFESSATAELLHARAMGRIADTVNSFFEMWKKSAGCLCGSNASSGPHHKESCPAFEPAEEAAAAPKTREWP